MSKYILKIKLIMPFGDDHLNTLHTLINYIQDLTFQDLPDPVVQGAKRSFLDTLSAMMAGSGAESPMRLLGLIREWGGREEGTILIHGDKVPLPHAAWVNAAMVRGFDFDEVIEKPVAHASATTIPVALGVCEFRKLMRHRPVSGQELITAVIMGNDLSCRLRRADKGPGTGWLSEPFNTLGAAALGARLFGFNQEALSCCLGIAYFQCCGNLGATMGEGGGMMAIIGQGVSANAAITSVLLADRGVTAQKDFLDGMYGLYKMYGNGSYDQDVLTGGLGKDFPYSHATIKAYPGCGATQAAIDGTLTLTREHAIKSDDVEQVILRVGKLGYHICRKTGNPNNTADALWSYPYSTAVALAKGDVRIKDFTEQAIHDPQVTALIPKVIVEMDSAQKLAGSADIEIKTKDGKQYRKLLEHAKGHPTNPVTWEDLTDKFRQCNAFSARPVSKEREKAIIDMIHGLEKVDDVTHIIEVMK
ncbi:MAG: MmgE/PrpD family protein [Deltaproteobacteria bacterium]|nr:MmgE/PrpD family protein [Deltaproteobacteria bacterium]